jgi:hypothetical protein
MLRYDFEVTHSASREIGVKKTTRESRLRDRLGTSGGRLAVGPPRYAPPVLTRAKTGINPTHGRPLAGASA